MFNNVDCNNFNRFLSGAGDSGSRVRVGVEGLGFGARKEVGTRGAGLRLKLTKLLKCL